MASPETYSQNGHTGCVPCGGGHARGKREEKSKREESSGYARRHKRREKKHAGLLRMSSKTPSRTPLSLNNVDSKPELNIA